MRRPYFFELFVLLNLAAVVFLAWESASLISPVTTTIAMLIGGLAVQVAIGVAVRIGIGVVRRDRSYVRRLRRRRWLIDTLRLIVGGALAIFTYGWLKLVVPLFHERNFDAALWDLDQTIFFGLSPSVFFLDLFGGAMPLRIVDWSYANIFYVSTVVATAYFFSHPSGRIRIAFANGNVALWLIGAWLYFAVPSLGPAYRFPDVWFPHAESLQRTQELQALLMRNWLDVWRAWRGEPHRALFIAFGIAAFPSLHVAFQTYVFLWMRRLWTSGEALFAVFALMIFLGSMITGWHYLVDGLAGIVLAYAAYRVSFRRARVATWLERQRS